MGRPSDYSPEIADLICERLIESDYGLEDICRADDLPNVRTVFRWLKAHPDFRQQYALAREAQAEVQAGRGMKEALTAKDASLGRLKLDARKWRAAHLAPKVYGSKVALTGGSDEDAPLRMDLSVLDTEELERLEQLTRKLAVAGGDQDGDSEAEG